MYLKVEKADKYTEPCDGCGKCITPGELHITGISCCCGGCYRILCFSCIKQAKLRVDEAELLIE